MLFIYGFFRLINWLILLDQLCICRANVLCSNYVIFLRIGVLFRHYLPILYSHIILDLHDWFVQLIILLLKLMVIFKIIFSLNILFFPLIFHLFPLLLNFLNRNLLKLNLNLLDASSLTLFVAGSGKSL